MVVEEGPPATPGRDAMDAFARLYRDAGTLTTLGREPMPLLQGRCVGGTTVINGAIQVPLPREVWEAWPEAFKALAPWEALEAAREDMDRELHVRPTPEPLWGPGRLLREGLPGASPAWGRPPT